MPERVLTAEQVQVHQILKRKEIADVSAGFPIISIVAIITTTILLPEPELGPDLAAVATGAGAGETCTQDACRWATTNLLWNMNAILFERLPHPVYQYRVPIFHHQILLLLPLVHRRLRLICVLILFRDPVAQVQYRCRCRTPAIGVLICCRLPPRILPDQLDWDLCLPLFRPLTSLKFQFPFSSLRPEFVVPLPLLAVVGEEEREKEKEIPDLANRRNILVQLLEEEEESMAVVLAVRLRLRLFPCQVTNSFLR